MWDRAYALARILLPILFVVEGLGTLANVAGMARMLQTSSLPVPAQFDLFGISRFVLLGYLVGLIEVVFGMMVIVGYRARVAALVLIVFTICTILVGHPFWMMEGQIRALNQTEALKNLSIIAGLLIVAALGAGPFALDNRRRR